MTLELIDASGAEYRNARFLAKAVELAYLNEPEGAEAFRSQLGLKAKLISVGNTQAYVGQNDQAIVVAFRGTESPATLEGLKDWLLTNANNFLVLPEGRIGTDFAAAGVGARFHRGFMEALADIWEPLAAAVLAAEKEKERPLWLTGHSLGGALALLAAWRFHQQFVPVCQIHTFGAPMIGNETAARAFEKEFAGKIYRYVDDRDFVPRLPTVSLLANAYTHCQTEMLLGSARAADVAAASALESLSQLASKAVDDVLSATLVDELWAGLLNGVSAHLMPNYQSRVEEKCTG